MLRALLRAIQRCNGRRWTLASFAVLLFGAVAVLVCSAVMTSTRGEPQWKTTANMSTAVAHGSAKVSSETSGLGNVSGRFPTDERGLAENEPAAHSSSILSASIYVSTAKDPLRGSVEQEQPPDGSVIDDPSIQGASDRADADASFSDTLPEQLKPTLSTPRPDAQIIATVSPDPMTVPAAPYTAQPTLLCEGADRKECDDPTKIPASPPTSRGSTHTFSLDFRSRRTVSTSPRSASATASQWPSPRRRTRGARVLVLMVDNRDLAENATWIHAGYNALAAVANALYAKRHGYDFRYVRLLTDTMRDVSEAWRNRIADPKRRNSCRHPLLGQYRAASWCKLPVIWGAVGEGYDWVVFADSDAVIREPAVSVDDFLARHTRHRRRTSESQTPGGLASGPPLSSASLVFLADWPFSSLPCAGFFLSRGGRAAQDVLRRWWDVDNPATNLRHAYEQDALWSLWPRLSRSAISTVAEWSFVKDSSPQWVRHMSSEEALLRSPYIRDLLSRSRAARGYGLSPKQFDNAMQQILLHSYVTLPSSDLLTDAMAALTQAASYSLLPSARPSATPLPSAKEQFRRRLLLHPANIA